MDLLEDRDQALLVDDRSFSVSASPAAELFEDVVHAGDRQLRDAAPAGACDGRRVLAEVADALLCVSASGEGEGIKAACFVVARSFFQRTAGGQRPGHMDAAREHTEHNRVIER